MNFHLSLFGSRFGSGFQSTFTELQSWRYQQLHQGLRWIVAWTWWLGLQTQNPHLVFAPGLDVWVWKVFLLEGTSKARSECFCCCAKYASKKQAWFVLFLSYLKTHANLKHISNLVSSVSLLLNPRKAVALVSQPPLPGMCIKDSVRQALHALRCAHLGEADAFQRTEEEVRMSRPTAFMSPPTPENTRGTQGQATPSTPASSTTPFKEAPVKGEICPNCSLALKVECFGSNNWRGILPNTKMVNKKMPSWKGAVYMKGFCCVCNCLDRILIHPKAFNASLQCVWLTCCHFRVSLVRSIKGTTMLLQKFMYICELTQYSEFFFTH